MCYPVYGMVHIKELLLIIGMSSPCGGSKFPISLSELSYTICPTPYNRKKNVLSTSLIKMSCNFYMSFTHGQIDNKKKKPSAYQFVAICILAMTKCLTFKTSQ